MATTRMPADLRPIVGIIAEARRCKLEILEPPGLGAYDMRHQGIRRRGRLVLFDVYDGQGELRGGMYRSYLMFLARAETPLQIRRDIAGTPALDQIYAAMDDRARTFEVARLRPCVRRAIDEIMFPPAANGD